MAERSVGVEGEEGGWGGAVAAAGIGSGFDAPDGVVGSALRGRGRTRIPPPRVRRCVSRAGRRQVFSRGGRQDARAVDGDGRRRRTACGAELPAVVAWRSSTRCLVADSRSPTALVLVCVLPPPQTPTVPVPTLRVSDAGTEKRLPNPLPARRHSAPSLVCRWASPCDRQPRTVLVAHRAQISFRQHPVEPHRSKSCIGQHHLSPATDWVHQLFTRDACKSGRFLTLPWMTTDYPTAVGRPDWDTPGSD